MGLVPDSRNQFAFPVSRGQTCFGSSLWIFGTRVLSETMSDEIDERIVGEEGVLDDSSRITALESNVEKMMGALEELVSRKRSAQEDDDASSAAKLKKGNDNVTSGLDVDELFPIEDGEIEGEDDCFWTR